MMKTTDITKFVKKNKKMLLIALGVIVAAVVAWIVWKKTKGVDTKDKELAEQATGQSITPGLNWNDLADRIRRAFSGPSSSGTDEAEVYAVLATLRNQADWEYMKRYWTTYCDSLPWWKRLNDNLMNTGNYKSIIASLKYELSSGELQHCREILQSKGITPDF